MNIRKVFRSSTHTGPGIDKTKCLALVTAAYNGDLEEVVRLTSDPEVDVDFMAYLSKPRWNNDNHSSDSEDSRDFKTEYHSAISAAVINGHSQVALFLLQQGVKVDGLAQKHYCDVGCFESVLSIACVKWKQPPCDLNVFKHLLHATEVINHDFVWAGRSTLAKFLIESKDGLPHKEQRIGLFFHEAVLRSDTQLIDLILESRKSVKFDVASCQDYLEDIELTVDQCLRARKGLDYLAEMEFLSKDTCQKIKNIIQQKTQYLLELNELPAELQISVGRQVNRSLRELFAEFQYWLLPDEHLLPGLVEGSGAKGTINLDDDELKRIQRLQDPKLLRQYVELQPLEFLTMLYDSMSPQGECVAAVLLSQILMFHRNDLLDDGKPLFNQDQEKSCFLIIKRLYNLSDSEKLTLISRRNHCAEVRELRYENTVLQGAVADGNGKIKALDAKVDELVAIVQVLQAQLNDPQEKMGMKRAHSHAFKF